MNVLVVDVGGTIKILATGQKEPRKFPSGPTTTARWMVSAVKELVGNWKYDVVSIGYPGLVLQGRVASEPHNLARDGSGLISKPHSGVRSRLSMMRPCNPWGAIRRARCSSWASEPGSAPPWS
jgi:polyphosphate glucokinase